MIFQDVRKTALQAYFKNKAWKDKNVNASKLKQSDYSYAIQMKADYQGSKIHFTGFRWIGPYSIQKVLPNNNYLVRKIGATKTQVVHQMSLRQITPIQRISDIQITPRQWKPDEKLSLNTMICTPEHGSVKTRNQSLIAITKNLVTPHSPKITVQSRGAADENRTTPGNIQKSSPETFLQTDRPCDGTDTDDYMQPDVDTSVDQPDRSPTNHRSLKFDRRHNPKPRCTDDYWYWICPTTVYGTHTYTFRNS